MHSIAVHCIHCASQSLSTVLYRSQCKDGFHSPTSLSHCSRRLEDTRKKLKEDRKKAAAAQPKQRRDLAVSAATKNASYSICITHNTYGNASGCYCTCRMCGLCSAT